MTIRTKSRRTTLADVAREAGVSATTVSLILSGRKQWLQQFHPDTIQSVRAAAEKLRYRANLMAAGLPRNAAPFIALIIRDFGEKDPNDWHLWAFEGELLVGVAKAGAEQQLYPIVTFAEQSSDDQSFKPIERVIEGGVFGSIVRTPNEVIEKYLLAKIKRGARVVAVFPYQPSRWPSNAIVHDNVEVGRRAGALLAAQGRKKWAIALYAGRRPRETHALRLEGFKEVAEKSGASVEIVRLPRLIDEITPEDMDRFRRIDADGFFGADSVLSVCALQMCYEVGRELGRDYNLVGVNCSRWISPPLPRITSVEVSWQKVGEVALQQLIKLSKDGQDRFETIMMKPDVVQGDTCPIHGHHAQ